VADGTHEAGEVGRGAAEAAPTAPHATPPPEGRSSFSGPERFWSHKRWRVAFASSLVLSAALHYAIAPWSLFPKEAFEIHDVDGTLSIPVDLLKEAPPPPPPPPPPAPPPDKTDEAAEALAAARRRDAGPPPPRDAEADRPDRAAPEGGEIDGTAVDGAPLDAASDAELRGDGPEAGPSLEDGGAVASIDGEATPGNPRDAVGMIGAAGNVQAGVQNVILTVNMAVIRTHPEGKRLGPLISAVPQWDDFLQGTKVDPLADIDWVSINGPALLHTEKDVILVHYAAPDAVVDQAIVALGKKHGHGGPADVGVPGVKAVHGYADRAERIFLRPQPHVLAVVPKDYARTAAKILTKASVPAVLKRPEEAMRLTLVHPHGPMPGIPESVTELRLWIIPRNGDGGADVYGEGDTASASDCAAATEAISRRVQDQNSFGVQLLTHGLLNGVELRADGQTVRLHMSASKDQIEVILAFVGGQLGVPMPPEPAESKAPH
jgi:hypothetical protein